MQNNEPHSDDLARAILKSIGDPMLIVNAQWDVCQMNSAAASLFGTAVDDALIAGLLQAAKTAHARGQTALPEWITPDQRVFIPRLEPITRVDGRPVGDGQVGPVVRQLFEIFARHVKGPLKNAA